MTESKRPSNRPVFVKCMVVAWGGAVFLWLLKPVVPDQDFVWFFLVTIVSLAVLIERRWALPYVKAMKAWRAASHLQSVNRENSE